MAQEITLVDTNLNTGGFTVFEQKSITRPANVTQYAANDIIAGINSTYLLYDLASVVGGYIVYAKLTTNDTGLDTGTYRVHILKTNSIATYTDNAALALSVEENRDKYISRFDLTFADVGGQANAIDDRLRIPFSAAKGTEDKSCIIAVVQALGTPTPSGNSTVMTLELGLEQNVEGMQNGNAQPIGD